MLIYTFQCYVELYVYKKYAKYQLLKIYTKFRGVTQSLLPDLEHVCYTQEINEVYVLEGRQWSDTKVYITIYLNKGNRYYK